MKVKVMDTTLRDGEQTSRISFTPGEKLNIAKVLLGDLKLDRIEVASARVSEGEFQCVKKVAEWAKTHGYLESVEVLGFIDGNLSIDWIADSGARVVNLLSKGSLNHLTGQLRKTPEQHISDIREVIDYAGTKGISCNIYLEDWSNGMRHSQDYVFTLLDAFTQMSLGRIMLPDTLGILNPDETYDYCKLIVDRYPGGRFDFHPHNDYDLAVANAYASVKAGIDCIHTTVNGLGERAGNAPLSSVIAVLVDQLDVELSLDEQQIYKASKLVEMFSGIRVPENKPVIGENVFTQTSGIHADGDKKNKLYYNDLLPERFGRKRKYALGKLAGKANIMQNLRELGIEMDTDSMKKVTKRVIELGDKKEDVTTEDLPYIIADVLKSERISERIRLINYSLSHAQGLRSVATLKISVDGEQYEETASGDGQYDAFMIALRRIYNKLDRHLPTLLDYYVSIPPGGKTDALVEAVIVWAWDREFRTRGLDSDQTAAAIKATVKMLNIIENHAE